jgi:predicted Rossmann-fold nucleotide-binding protein
MELTMIMSWGKKGLLALSIMAFGTVSSTGGTYSKYKKVTAKEVVINIDNFKLKRIQFETRMKKIVANTPEYIKKEFSRKKYIYIKVGAKSLPLIGKIKDLEKILKKTKKNTRIIVFGRVKEFWRSRLPKNKKRRKYYVFVDKIELAKKTDQPEEKI